MEVHVNPILIEVKGELPPTVHELRRLAIEDFYKRHPDELWAKYSARSENQLIAYLRHNHTNYEELIKGIDDGYEYSNIKTACNEKAYELLAEIRKSNQ